MKNPFANKAFRENPFRFYAKNSVLNPKDLGIAGERTSVLTPENAACGITCLQSCPWSATGLNAQVIFDGETLPGTDWVWLPNAILRRGKRAGYSVATLTVVPPAHNGILMRMAIESATACEVTVPVAVAFSGSAGKTSDWAFNAPKRGLPHYADAVAACEGDMSLLRLIGGCADVGGREVDPGDAVIAVACSLPGMKLFRNADMWETTVTVKPHETVCIDLAICLGDQDGNPEKECRDMLENGEKETEKAFAWLKSETDRIFSALPSFKSDNKALERLYTRSLVAYTLNRWNNPQFAIQPFYSTGSVTGGCMCSYLWDYGGGLMLHPVVDPGTNKKMICAYLHDDLTVSYAIKPLDGGPAGLWYHINQEKIISMIYYHVLHTGDVGFLKETVDGKSIRDWAVFHSLIGDDLAEPQHLVDFGGAGESHLELRRSYAYKGVMPDLNARRYMNYMRAYELTVLDGSPMPELAERAKALKPLLATLWNEDKQWYDHIWEGKRDQRYTVQMFKFLNSPVIDEQTRRGLISHLNEEEFLSEYGLHSMAKTDPGYDQVDIDNGGGGICNLFTMQIAGQLYDMGYAETATDMVDRVLWWGTRLPYWGDSCAANMKKVREDTPLQACISSASGAQMILFNMCGIKADAQGGITVCPAKVLPAKELTLKGVKLLGRTFSVAIRGDHYTVTVGGRKLTAPLGEKTTI